MHDVYQAQVYSNYGRRHTGQSLEDEAMQMQISIERARQPGWTSPGRGEGGAVAGGRKQVAGVGRRRRVGRAGGASSKSCQPDSATGGLPAANHATQSRATVRILLAAMMKPA